MKHLSIHGSIFTERDLLPFSEVEKFLSYRRIKYFMNNGCRCVKCGAEGKYIAKKECLIYILTDNYIPLTVDHIIPKSEGGCSTQDNLQILCRECNIIKSSINNDLFMSTPNEVICKFMGYKNNVTYYRLTVDILKKLKENHMIFRIRGNQFKGFGHYSHDIIRKDGQVDVVIKGKNHKGKFYAHHNLFVKYSSIQHLLNPAVHPE